MVRDGCYHKTLAELDGDGAVVRATFDVCLRKARR